MNDKKWIIVVVILTAVLLVVGGLDLNANSKLSDANDEVVATQTELDSVQSELDTINSDLKTAEADLESANTMLAIAQECADFMINRVPNISYKSHILMDKSDVVVMVDKCMPLLANEPTSGSATQ